MMAAPHPSIIPAMAPPPGVVPNFENPVIHHLIPTIIIFAIGLTGVAVLVPMLCATRKLIAKRFFLDDYVLLAATICYLALCSLALTGFHYGLGVHQWELPYWKSVNVQKFQFAVQVIYTPTTLVTKISILLQLKRIFTPKRNAKAFWVLLVLVYFSAIFAVATIILKLNSCHPIEKTWNFRIPGKCMTMLTPNVIIAAVNLVSDLTILSLLVIWTRRLQLSRAKKWGIAVIFSLGCLSCLSCVIRCFVLAVQIKKNPDLTYKYADMNIWMFVHTTTLILCAAIPSLPAFFTHFRKRVNGLSDKWTNNTSDSHTAVASQNTASVYIATKPKGPYSAWDDDLAPGSQSGDLESGSPGPLIEKPTYY